MISLFSIPFLSFVCKLCVEGAVQMLHSSITAVQPLSESTSLHNRFKIFSSLGMKAKTVQAWMRMCFWNTHKHQLHTVRKASFQKSQMKKKTSKFIQGLVGEEIRIF